MKTRVNQEDNITDIESLVNQDNQVQDSAEQAPTPWQRIYNEYKSNTEALKKKYSPLLKEEILFKQSKDIYSLANIFKDIAENNIKLAKIANTNPSLKLYYYNDAAIVCHHGLSILERANCNNDLRLQTLENKICRDLNLIQTYIVHICSGNLELLQHINNKSDLSNISKSGIIEQLRTKTKEQLKNIEAAKAVDSSYIELTANTFKQVASGMEQYIATLYGEAEAILGPPPCDYTVIGLGSIALRQITPYSDLEFAILTDNDHYKQSDDFTVREYFKNLTHLVHFKVINLGETIMPISSYGFNFKDFIKTAVNFDLGGKTPLGRIEKDKPYELIQTVEGMVNYLKNEGNKTSNIDKTLPFILQKTCPIYQYGEKDLAAEYQSNVQEFLLSIDETNGRPHCENRAVQILSKEGVEIDYTLQVPQACQKTPGNLKQFSFNANKAHGKLFDVKQEIYRMPDRFIYNLGFIYGIQEESSWETIDKLCVMGKITAEGALSLKKALSFATNLRLKTYSHYGYQKDMMDYAKTYDNELYLQSNKVEEVEKELAIVFKLTHEDLEEEGAFFNYYYTALALRNSLEEFCKLDDSDKKEEFFSNISFYQDDASTKAQINLRLLRYENALKYQLKELEILKNKHSEDQQAIATSLNNIGDTYRALGNHHTALEYHREALEIRQSSLSNNRPDIAISLNNIGGIYGELGDHYKALKYEAKALRNYKEALRHMEEALDIRREYQKDSPLIVAQSLNNVGGAYRDLGNYKEALRHMEEALDIRREYQEDNPSIVAQSLSNIGTAYGELGNHNKALEDQKKALKIAKGFLGNNHPNIATILNNIGTTYGELGNYDKASERMKEALIILQKSLGSSHTNTISCNHNVFQILKFKSIYDNTLEETNKALKDITILHIKNCKEASQAVRKLEKVLNQCKECSNCKKSEVIDKKILQTLDLLVKAQTSLYQNSKKNKLAIRKILNSYQKEYEDLKKSIEDKQVKLQEIEVYLAIQKQVRDEQSDTELANKALSLLETNSSFEDMAEKIDLLSLSGTLTEKNNDYEGK